MVPIIVGDSKRKGGRSSIIVRVGTTRRETHRCQAIAALEQQQITLPSVALGKDEKRMGIKGLAPYTGAKSAPSGEQSTLTKR